MSVLDLFHLLQIGSHVNGGLNSELIKPADEFKEKLLLSAIKLAKFFGIDKDFKKEIETPGIYYGPGLLSVLGKQYKYFLDSFENEKLSVKAAELLNSDYSKRQFSIGVIGDWISKARDHQGYWDPEDYPSLNVRGYVGKLEARLERVDKISEEQLKKTNFGPESDAGNKAGSSPVGGIDMNGIKVNSSVGSSPVAMPMFDLKDIEGFTFRIVKLSQIKDINLAFNFTPVASTTKRGETLLAMAK